MDYKDTQKMPSEQTSTVIGKLKGWLAKVRIYGLRDKLILPYLLLTVLLAIIGTFIVIRLVAYNWKERFYNQLYASNVAARDIIRQQQNTHLRNLRTLVSISYVPKAVQERNTQQLKDLFDLIQSNNIEFLSIVDHSGQEIISWARNPTTGQYAESSDNKSLREFDPVAKTFSMSEDPLDKHVGILTVGSDKLFVTSAPVRDAAGELQGVMLIGTPLSTLISDIANQALVNHAILLDNNYNIIISTFPSLQPGDAESTTAGGEGIALDSTQAAIQNHLQDLYDKPLDPNGSEKNNLREIALSDRIFTIYYNKFNVRDEVSGWLGVGLTNDYQTSPVATNRLLLVVLFSIGTAAVIVIGYLLAQSIARPILKLRDLSQEVAAGDLNHQIGLQRSDEIGELAQAFDQMTLQLRERTDEAARLFDLTVQRNKELAYINARLQSMQLQLIQAEKLAAVGQLTAGIVHDVKNPLAVIKGLSEVLLGNDLSPEERQHLNIIHESAVKANTIVTDLLKFARQSTPEKKFQDLRETVEASLRLTAYLSRKANIEIAKDLPERSVMMWYDSQQLEQVFINIITNAIQAMPEKGILQVAMKKTESTVAIAFKDNGAGIPTENLNRIFDPFFTTKAEGQGTGLGLSVSYGIISNHNGHIQVESKVGEGSTFTIILPIEQSSPSQGVM